MDSTQKIISDKYLKEVIQIEEYQNDEFDECLSDGQRTNLILNFFRFLKVFNLDRRLKEKAIVFFDLVAKSFSVSKNFLKIFLLALLNITSKLEKGTKYSKEILEKILESTNEIKYSVNNADLLKICEFPTVKFTDINMAEILLLNSLEWRLNRLIFSDYTDFFVKNYLTKIFQFINETGFYLVIDFFTECVLSAFNTNKIPLHSLAVSIILLAVDQFKSPCSGSCSGSYKDLTSNSFDGDVKVFLEICLGYYKIDLVRVENYKLLLLEYIDKMNVNINKVYPDFYIPITLEYFQSVPSKKSKSNKVCKYSSSILDINLSSAPDNNYYSENVITSKKFRNLKNFQINNEKEDKEEPGSLENRKNPNFIKSKEFEEDVIILDRLTPCSYTMKKSSSFKGKHLSLIKES